MSQQGRSSASHTEPGAALRAVLEARGCALSAHEARALADSLIGLICSGLIVAETPETAHAKNIGQSVCIEGQSE